MAVACVVQVMRTVVLIHKEWQAGRAVRGSSRKFRAFERLAFLTRSDTHPHDSICVQADKIMDDFETKIVELTGTSSRSCYRLQRMALFCFYVSRSREFSQVYLNVVPESPAPPALR